jgi:hypothetical protein
VDANSLLRNKYSGRRELFIVRFYKKTEDGIVSLISIGIAYFRLHKCMAYSIDQVRQITFANTK